MSFRTQERVTVKITYAGDREPEYHHWAADSVDFHPEGKKARAFYEKTLRDKTLEVAKVELYKEHHAYQMTLSERWEREPTHDSGDGAA